MAETIQWSAAWTGATTVLSTEMNSLAAGSRTTLGSTAFTNSTILAQYGIIRLNLTYTSTPGTGDAIWLYMVQQVDGSNYAQGGSTVDPGVHNIIAFVPIYATQSAQIIDSPIFALPPSNVKFLLTNKASSASMASSGNTAVLYYANDYVYP
jgi:hypothetical protein